MFHIWSKGLKIDFQNRKWNHPNRKWNYFCNFQASDHKLLFNIILIFDSFHNWSKGFKINFQIMKWNYPNRKWNFFPHFQASYQKNSFTTLSPYQPRNLKFVFKTENGIIQTGNEIISLTSKALIKKTLFQKLILNPLDQMRKFL